MTPSTTHGRRNHGSMSHLTSPATGSSGERPPIARDSPSPPPSVCPSCSNVEADSDSDSAANDVVATEHVTRAQVLAAGRSDGWRKRQGLHHTTRGVWSTTEPPDWRARAHATSLVLPESSGFCLSTAGSIHGFSLPARHEEQEDLHVITPSGLAQRRRPGWVGHTGAERRTLMVVDGLVVTDQMDTWVDLGAWAVCRPRELTIEDLVVIGDEVINALITSEPRLANRSRLGRAQAHLDPQVVNPVLAQIRTRLDQRAKPKLRGRRALEEALPLMRAGVKSPQETRARLMFVNNGFPEPLVNANLHSADDGGWLAEGDLVWREARTVVEYQGGDHARRKRRSNDSDRLQILRDEGYDAFEAWAEDVRPGARQVALLQRVWASLHRKR